MKDRKSMDAEFEKMEHDNERRPMSSERSHMTPESVAMDCYGVYEMKNEAMDEAYGATGKRGAEGTFSKIKSQFMDYNWS